jgi:DNA polymerase-4
MSLNVLYVDFNSYFASVEQKLVPELCGKPVGVIAVIKETNCYIAASYEAKHFALKLQQARVMPASYVQI